MFLNQLSRMLLGGSRGEAVWVGWGGGNTLRKDFWSLMRCVTGTHPPGCGHSHHTGAALLCLNATPLGMKLLFRMI